jgi:[ribosomal protein S5]-alanine N-acetyltransferase
MLILNFNPFPVINTERLVLRQLTKDDADSLFWVRSNLEVGKYIPRQPYQSKEDAIAFITKTEIFIPNNESIIWAIATKNTDTVIGTICLWNIKKEDYRAEVGYELHPNYWGKGIMQEALTVVLDYGFRDMKLHSIAAVINPDNEASIKLVEKNKFIKEAHFKEDYYHNEKFRDTAIYSLLTPE